MISTTYNAEDLFLFPYPANFDPEGAGVYCEAAIPSVVGSGKSDWQARIAYGESLRIPTFRFSLRLDRLEARELKDGLLAHTIERIAVPFWPLARPTAEYADLEIKGSLAISFPTNSLGYPLFGDGFEIHTGDTPAGSYANSYTAPLLLCFFVERPVEAALETDEDLTLDIEFAEDSDYDEALLVAAQTFTDGPTLADASGAKVFPLLHDFASPANSGGSSLYIERDKIGQSRREERQHFGALANREIDIVPYFTSELEAAKALRFFLDHRGMAKPFWAPAYLADARLTADAADDAEELEVDDATSIALHQWIAVLTPDGEAYRKVTAIDGGTLTLDAAIGIAVPYQQSSICPLVYARFDKAILPMQWRSDIDGQVSCFFSEVSSEYAPDADETRGSTVGDLGLRCYLYEFIAAGYNPWLYTGYERDLFDDPDTYVANGLKHSDIERGTLLEDNCTLEAFIHQCEPLRKLAFGELAELEVRIYKATPSGGTVSGLTRKFTGQVRRPKHSGIKLEADCKFMGDLLDGQILPRMGFTRSCSHDLFSPGCGLDIADWTFSAVFADVGTAGWPYTFTIDTITRDNLAANPAFPANFFAGGMIWVDDGTGLQSQFIAASTALFGGEITITTAGDFAPYPVDTDTLKLIPACDGQKSTCSGRFGNQLNHGGNDVARGNLSLIKVSETLGGGKK